MLWCTRAVSKFFHIFNSLDYFSMVVSIRWSGILTVVLMIGFTIHGFGQRKKQTSFIKVPDIRYTTAENAQLNTLDIYMPRKGSKSPVIVWLHGGAWTTGDKSHVQAKPEYFTKHGFIFISVNYRLSPEVKHPAHVEDVAQALHWIRTQVHHYSGDASRIIVMGHSAGAHLAALVSTNEVYLNAAGSSLALIKGVILLDGGGYDIEKLMPQAGPKLRQWYEQAFGTTRKQWIAASPVTYVAADKSIPPFLILHAGQRDLSAEEAMLLSGKLKGNGIKCEVIHYPKKNHLTINRELGEEDDQTTADIMQFISKVISLTGNITR